MTADVPDGEAFAAWRVRRLEPAEFARLTVRDRLWHLAELSLLAPSSHNTVPVRYQLCEKRQELTFLLDRAAILRESDVLGRQATISLGCALENANLAARCYGLNARVTCGTPASADLRPLSSQASRTEHPSEGDRGRSVNVATLTLSDPVEPLPASVLESMLARKVVRAEFDERVSVEADLAAQVVRVASALDPRIAVHWIGDAAGRAFIGKYQEVGDATVLNRPSFARELGEWLLPNDSDATVGMRGREFGLSDEAARRLSAGLVGRERLLPDELAGFAKAGTVLMRSASAIVVLGVSEDEVTQWVAAGRIYQRMALLLGEHGYRTALHAALVELEAPNQALRGRLRTAARPTVVFRVGKPLRPEDDQRPHSARPPLASLVVSP